MKKILLLLVPLILFCGCSNKLTCYYKETYEDVKIKNKITFNFKDKTYKQVDTMTFATKEAAENYFKDIEDYIEEYNLVLNDKKIISEIEDEIKLNGTIKEIKEQYESYDYTCK